VSIVSDLDGPKRLKSREIMIVVLLQSDATVPGSNECGGIALKE